MDCSPQPAPKRRIVCSSIERHDASKHIRCLGDTYEKRQLIGRGTYGEVYYATEKSVEQGGQASVWEVKEVALKKIVPHNDDGFPIGALRDIKHLQQLRNDNVLRLREVVYEAEDDEDEDAEGKVLCMQRVRFYACRG